MVNYQLGKIYKIVDLSTDPVRTRSRPVARFHWVTPETPLT